MPDLITTYGESTYGAHYYGQDHLPSTPELLMQVWTPSGWVDVTCDLRRLAIDRGRSSYVDAFGAGTMTASLANEKGVYSGWSVFGIWAQSSPYRIDVPVRVRLFTGSTSSGLFTGTTDAVTDSWPDIVDAQADVAATDGFKQLSRHNGLARTAVGAGELAGARINRIADDAGYTGTRRIDTGTVALQATDLKGVAIDLMRQVGESEWGWLYFNREGELTFRQRDVVQTDPRMTTVQWTFTDEDRAGAVCYGDLQLPVDDDALANVATVTPPGIATQTAQDAASVAWFGPRTWSRDDLPFANATDALGLAQLIVLQLASATRRITGLSFRASLSADAYACAVGVRMGDRIRVLRAYPDGYVLDAELLVYGIHHTIEADGSGLPQVWDVKLDTADALLVRDYGQWDDALFDSTDLWGV